MVSLYLIIGKSFRKLVLTSPTSGGGVRRTSIIAPLGASHMVNSIASLSALDADYCAPERVRRSDGGSACSTREADVYSLGVTLTELFTGLPPILQRGSVK